MARVAGVALPNRRLFIALQSVYGVGASRSKKVCREAGLSDQAFVSDLSEDDIVKLRKCVGNYRVGEDLRRDNIVDIKKLESMMCYRGRRHRLGLPVRGQSTHRNARTRRGRARPIPGKK